MNTLLLKSERYFALHLHVARWKRKTSNKNTNARVLHDLLTHSKISKPEFDNTRALQLRLDTGLRTSIIYSFTRKYIVSIFLLSGYLCTCCFPKTFVLVRFPPTSPQNITNQIISVKVHYIEELDHG